MAHEAAPSAGPKPGIFLPRIHDKAKAPVPPAAKPPNISPKRKFLAGWHYILGSPASEPVLLLHQTTVWASFLKSTDCFVMWLGYAARKKGL